MIFCIRYQIAHRMTMRIMNNKANQYWWLKFSYPVFFFINLAVIDICSIQTESLMERLKAKK